MSLKPFEKRILIVPDPCKWTSVFHPCSIWRWPSDSGLLPSDNLLCLVAKQVMTSKTVYRCPESYQRMLNKTR